MFVSVFVVLGIFSFFNLKLEKQPKIDFPVVTITLVYPGATPNEIETSITKKIEDGLSEISEIKKIRSYSYENMAYIFVEFLLSSDVNTKLIETKDKVDALLSQLPDAMKKPIVAKFNPFQEAVIDFALSSERLNPKELYELADTTLKDKILAIKGVANIEIFGGEKRQINVLLDPMLMREHYVALDDVIATLKMKNKNIPGGVLENGDTSFNLRFMGEFENVHDIENTALLTRNGEMILLKEIAKVEDGVKKTDKIARFNGKNVVGISVKKTSDSNAVDIAKSLHKKMAVLTKVLPKKTLLEIANDTTTVIVKENYNTLLTILEGILLTVAILFLFSGSFRLTLVSSITIPISIVSAFFLMDLSNFSINFLTLLAIATSIGILVANTFVVIESFWKHFVQKGKNAFDAAVDGTKEVAVAVLASTGTHLVVFAPIVFMGGIVGRFMVSFGLTVIYITAFSLAVSFALTPMLCYTILKNDKRTSNKLALVVSRFMNFLVRKYETIFQHSFRYAKTFCVLIIFGVFSIKFLTPYISKSFMPDSDRDLITIHVEMPQGTLIENTLAMTKYIEKKVSLKTPEIKSYFSLIGRPGVEKAQIALELVPHEKRKRTDLQIIDELVPFLSTIAEADISLTRGPKMGLENGDITLNIEGADFDQMVSYMQKLKDQMIETGYFRSVSSTYHVPKKEVKFYPNQKKLQEFGLKELQLGSILRTAIVGDTSNVFKTNNREYDILVKLDEKYAKDYSDMRYIDVISKKGLVPILEMGSLQEQKAIPMLEHENKKSVLKLNGFLAKSDPGHVMQVLEKVFEKVPKEKNISYRFAGVAERQEESSLEIVKAFILAVILTYMLLAAILNSFVWPISILLSVVTSFIGVYYTLFFLDESINLSSMLGFVMLVGLVVNNSILLLDDAIQKMKENMPLKEALWSAASSRFQVILMTSLAIILGVLPQVWDIMPFKSSMGTVMLGGMIGSFIFSLIFTPLAFYGIEKLRTKLSSKKNASCDECKG